MTNVLSKMNPGNDPLPLRGGAQDSLALSVAWIRTGFRSVTATSSLPMFLMGHAFVTA